MKYRVHKSEDGHRVAILGKDGDFVASFVKGKWVAELPFDAHELEDLLLVTDQKEAESFFKKAKAALERKAAIA